jgi:hypothetical protein
MAFAIALSGDFKSHSHTVNVRHPDAASLRLFRLSRALFASSFGPQYSRLERGRRTLGQLWRCQKHPFTKMAFRWRTNTRSGLPGSERR